ARARAGRPHGGWRQRGSFRAARASPSRPGLRRRSHAGGRAGRGCCPRRRGTAPRGPGPRPRTTARRVVTSVVPATIRPMPKASTHVGWLENERSPKPTVGTVSTVKYTALSSGRGAGPHDKGGEG